MAVETLVVLSAIGGVLKIVDSLTAQWDRYFKKKSEAEASKPHRLTAEQVAPDVISISSHGRPIMKITAADIERLDPNHRALIKTYETAIQRNFELWQALYPQRQASSDAVVNAKLDQQLRGIAESICADLGKIFSFLDSIGAELEDHYGAFRYLCHQMKTGTI